MWFKCHISDENYTVCHMYCGVDSERLQGHATCYFLTVTHVSFPSSIISTEAVQLH